MNMILLTGPSLEPVTLAEMKLWLKIDGSEDDNVINALIVSARLSVEAVTKRILITQSWRVVLDEWRQGGLIRLPTGPLQSVTAARVYDAAGAATSVPVSTFLVDNSSRSPRLIVTGPVPSPGRVIAGIEIDCTLGYGASGSLVPEPLRLAGDFGYGAKGRSGNGDCRDLRQKADLFAAIKDLVRLWPGVVEADFRGSPQGDPQGG